MEWCEWKRNGIDIRVLDVRQGVGLWKVVFDVIEVIGYELALSLYLACWMGTVVVNGRKRMETLVIMCREVLLG